MRGERSTAQHGFATVWGVAWMGCCLGVGWLVLVLAVAVARQHHVDGSADLAALSAAHDLADGGDACTSAARVAVANRVALEDCSIVGTDVVVRVSDTLVLPVGITVRVTGQARAGPG